tara:strand:+ start:417 stop:1343 length:927 start_codon:yes stop_codon:yes gene_type:complete
MLLTTADLFLLNTDDWMSVVGKVHDCLKPQLQNKSFIDSVKSEYQEERKIIISDLVGSFYNTGPADLDNRILEFTNQIKAVNDSYQQALKYDFIGIIKTHEGVVQYDNLCKVRDFFLLDASDHLLAYARLSAVILEISNQSMGQGDKSNAGQAGENMVRAIFNSVGLVKDLHYREQYKSKVGSDTDFVLPNVDDYSDSQVDALVAVQFSTNDRARLASSELKQGGVRYMVTGNGLPASKKSLKAIGSQNLQNYAQLNIRLVCFDREIAAEKQRIKSMAVPDGERLKYFESSAISFSAFANKVERFKSP